MISTKLQNVLISKIEKSELQRITFAEYMSLALYHEHYGYYKSGVVSIGAKGDFFTSSSLGKDFGELLALQFIEMWQNLGFPNPFYLVEMGAGNGELAQDILDYLRQWQHTAFIKVLKYIIIEDSPALIKSQQERLANINFKHISWQNWSDISESSITGCFFSNELLDAFPVHRVIKKDNQLQEIYLNIVDGELHESIHPLSTARLTEYLSLIDIDLLSKPYSENYTTEINLNSLNWLKTLASKLNKGYVLTIDYGYRAAKYYQPSRTQGTLQCYFQHRRHNNPYANLGYQDITAHVDFTALQHQGELLELETLGFTQQGLFLMALGLGDRLNDLSSGKYNAIQIFKRRDALHQLIDPTGLGGFGVLVQGKNLTSVEKSIQGLSFPELEFKL